MKRKKQWMMLSEIIGGNVRRLRESQGILQEQIAHTARERFGFEWTQATIASIEAGKRRLSLEEFILLPMILSFGCLQGSEWVEHFVELPDLFPDALDIVRLSDSAFAESCRLREIIAGKASEAWGVSHSNVSGGPGWITPAKQQFVNSLPEAAKRVINDLHEFEAIRNQIAPNATKLGFVDVQNEAAGEAERKVARKFRTSPTAVAIAAREKWQRSLTAERDARISKIDTDNPRHRQAIRGHITRQLIDELAEELKPNSKSPSKRKPSAK